jgi:hypothetical protein
MLLAAVLPNGGITILLSSLHNLYLMTYAGFFVNLSKIPPVLRWLRWFDVLGYALEATVVNEVGAGLEIVDTLAAGQSSQAGRLYHRDCFAEHPNGPFICLDSSGKDLSHFDHEHPVWVRTRSLLPKRPGPFRVHSWIWSASCHGCLVLDEGDSVMTMLC